MTQIQKGEPGKETMEQRAKWMSIIQQIVTLIFLPWAGWVCAMIFAHSLAIKDLQTWRDGRPKFATQEQVSLAVIEGEKQLREKLTLKLDALLQNQQDLKVQATTMQAQLSAIDKRMSDHIEATKKP